MRYLVFGAVLLTAGSAFAQQPPPSPQVQACWQTLQETTAREIDWRTQATILQARVEQLGKELDAAKKAAEPKPDAKAPDASK